ncbi:hypothetical protein RB213_014855 [Colletotrichum asianum]
MAGVGVEWKKRWKLCRLVNRLLRRGGWVVLSRCRETNDEVRAPRGSVAAPIRDRMGVTDPMPKAERPDVELGNRRGRE